MNIKIILFIVAATIAAGCKNNTIEINGKLDSKLPDDYIILDELKSDELIGIDSVRLGEDCTFSFTRKVEFPSFYLLKTDNTNFLTMLLEPGQKIEIVAYRDSLGFPRKISGSPGTKLMIEYNRNLQATILKLKGLRPIYIESLQSPDLPKIMERIDSMAQSYLNSLSFYTKAYIDENLNSLVSLVALYQQIAPGEYVLNPDKDLGYFVKVDSSLFQNYPDYDPVKSLHEQVMTIVSDVKNRELLSSESAAGSFAPEIALPDPQGDTIRLSSMRGSVVLLDFWASWCSPCRAENPNLVKAYNLYHSKGFQIFQVSLDKTRESWLKGIQDDKLDKWIHVSDVKYWNSVVVPLYKIESIPFNYLLDSEGRIIASNLRGDNLQKKLAELFIN
jgi:thiol-disulfide isomerase/thioredoxin